MTRRYPEGAGKGEGHCQACGRWALLHLETCHPCEQRARNLRSFALAYSALDGRQRVAVWWEVTRRAFGWTPSALLVLLFLGLLAVAVPALVRTFTLLVKFGWECTP